MNNFLSGQYFFQLESYSNLAKVSIDCCILKIIYFQFFFFSSFRVFTESIKTRIKIQITTLFNISIKTTSFFK
jgi:hypothetical protein